MTKRERLLRIFRGEMTDRPAIELGGEPDATLPHPDYRPVHELARKVCDIRASAYSPFDIYYGRRRDQVLRTEVKPTASPDWVEVHTFVRTPHGDLSSVFTRSTKQQPGYEKEYLLKEPGDIQKLMSIPYEPTPFQPDVFRRRDARIGDQGIVMYGLDHAMYGLQSLIGPENFALWSLDSREELRAAIHVLAGRVREQAIRAMDQGLGPVFGWVGPEVCIPPLMSPTDFDEFVAAVDKPLIDLIHERGGYVWVHSHGRMGPVLERFMGMGVDVLNPVEAPPMGDLTLAEAFARVGRRMGLEGNIQTHELMTVSADEVRAMVRAALDAGRGYRFILCPTSSYGHQNPPTPRYIENLLAYLDEARRHAQPAKTG